MDQFKDYADERLINGCIYCGGWADTRDHVPSRILLEKPYPENLPVVGACQECNQGFSKDEQYLVCLLEAVLSGSTDPDMIQRESVARAMRRSPALRERIESARRFVGHDTIYDVEENRIQNVMLKLARGHAAFELSQECREDPDHFWCGPLSFLEDHQREEFEAAHIQRLFSEIGSRNMQRMFTVEASMQSESGEMIPFQGMVNDWLHVQEGRYRFLTIYDVGGIAVRIVISEYLACEVVWST